MAELCNHNFTLPKPNAVVLGVTSSSAMTVIPNHFFCFDYYLTTIRNIELPFHNDSVGFCHKIIYSLYNRYLP